MKLLAVIAIVVAGCASHAPCPATPTSPAAPEPAGKLEMKQYFLVLLRRGPAWSPEKTPETKKMFEGHMANIEAMAASGKLLIAGPMDADPADKTAVAGIFLFDVKTKEEVVELMKNDPAIAAGRLQPEILSWYGPANITYPGKVVPTP